MHSVFDQIKNRLNIVEYISKYVRLRMSGGRFFGLCPFHAEKTGSFSVDGTKGIFHCFGCQAGGDIFEFYMKYHNVDKKEALRALAQMAGVSLSERTQKKNALDLLCEFFEKNLSQPTHKLLESRGVTEESIKKFRIGISPDSASIMKFLNENKLSLSSFGFNDYSWKMFEHRIIFPIFDTNGSVCSFGGRIYKPNDTRAKYINGPASENFIKSQTLYGFHLTRSYAPIYVVEGYLDVIIMHQHGLLAVAPMGTAFGDGHLKMVLEKSREIIVAMDGDAAGRKSSLKIAYMAIEELQPEMEIKFIDFPDSHDPASYLNQHHALTQLKQQMLYEYIFMAEYVATPNPQKAAQIFKKLMFLAAKIKDTVLKSEYRKRWKDLWWNRDKRIQEIATVPSENHIPLLLFKYILMYPDILDEVAEHFARLSVNNVYKDSAQSSVYSEQLMRLLNNEPLDEDFIARIDSIHLIEEIANRADALAAWHKVATHIQQMGNQEEHERASALQENFSESEWEKFKQWMAQKEEDENEK